MADFQIYSETNAPEGARDTLAGAKAAFGFLPNLLGGLAESPATVEAYVTLSGLFDKTQLTAAERQVVLLAISYENECAYCLAAHTGAAKAAKLDEATISALRSGGALPDAKLNALADFTRKVVTKRGWVDQADLDTFFAVGYTKANVFDVILGLSLKTISNYANHIAETPLDKAFEPTAWTKAAA